MATLAELLVKVGLDAREVERGADKAAGAIDRFAGHVNNTGRKLQRVGIGLTAAVTAPLVALGAKAIDAASDLNESVNAIRVVFGPASKAIEAFGKTSAQTVGLSTRAFNELVTPVGAALQNVGFSAEGAASASINLAKRASDMASVFNVDVSDALEAIQAGLRGESDPLERFGVGLSEAAVQSKAMELGLGAAGRELTAQEKAQARLALIMDQTNKISGDFARTSGEVANQERIAKAEAENMAAAFGQKLIPIKAKLIEVAGKLLDMFNNLSPEMQNMILMAVGAAAALGPFSIALGTAVRGISSIIRIVPSLISGFTAVGKGFLALSKILLANPWILVALAIVALVIVVIKNWDTIKGAILTAWNAITGFTTKTWNSIVGFLKRNWTLIVAIITGPVGFLVRFIVQNWDAIRRFTVNIFNAVVGFFQGLPGRIQRAISWVISGIWAIFRNAALNTIGIVRWGIGQIVHFFAGLPRQIWNALSGLGSLLWNLGRNAFDNLARGLQSVVGRITSIASSIKDKIVSKLNPANWFSTPEEHYRKLWGAAFGAIADEGRHSVSKLESTIAKISGVTGGIETDIGARINARVAVPPPAEATRVVFDFQGADSEMGRALRKMVRVEGQGNAQAAFSG